MPPALQNRSSSLGRFTAPPPPAAAALRFAARESREAYLANIAACKDAIFEGESYEICLTTELHSDGAIEPLAAYRALRARNPAPHAALHAHHSFAAQFVFNCHSIA